MPTFPKVTTHRIDDHDAPGGTDLEVQLLDQADPGPTRVGKRGELVALVEHAGGLHFPARPGHAPVGAEVHRREPITAPEISLELQADSSIHNTDHDKVETDAGDNLQTAIAVPRRKLVTLGRFRVGASTLSDAGGNAVIELSPGQWGGNAGQGFGVQANQVWIVDRVIVRLGAAGTALVYAGSIGNDQDLVGVPTIQAVSFAGQIDGNPVALQPGWRVGVVVAGGGATLQQSAVAYYRLGVYCEGEDDDV